MSMHLHHPALSTTGKSKRKKKFKSAEEARRSRENQESWNQLLAQYKPVKRVESKKGNLSYSVEPPPGRSMSIGSSAGKAVGSALKKDDVRYTGNSIVGIGTMHKSCAVPVFSQQEAEEISKMRRG